MKQFQSTLPARGATLNQAGQPGGKKISIHAPRTGSDRREARRSGAPHYFNPRSPHGERPNIFQVFEPGEEISIHAPRTGSDSAK